MAVTQNTYTGNGATVLYSFTFPYLETTDVKVTINGTPTTAYTFANATTIQFNTAPANGAAIRIYRDTDDASLAATFYSGSAIRAQDLNDNFTQNLYVTQEVNNNSVNIDGSNPMVGPLNMNGFQIDNLAEPTTDSDAATKKYIDDRYGNLGIPGHTRWRKVATASQTIFSGTGDYGGVLAYSPTREQVYINGALQQRGVDYAADNGTSVVFTVGLTVGDVVDIICVNNLTNSSVSNAANITYSGQFTGQTARTVAAKLTDVISVKDFGAVGDGVTDDTAAIQAAVNAAVASGARVWIPKTSAFYAIPETAISITLADGQKLVIESDGAEIRRTGAVGGVMLNVACASAETAPLGTNTALVVRGLTFDGRGVPEQWGLTNWAQVQLLRALNTSVEYLTVENCNFNKIYGYGINSGGVYRSTIRSCSFREVGGHWYVNDEYDAFGDGVYHRTVKENANILISHCNIIGYANNYSRIGVTLEYSSGKTYSATVEHCLIQKYDRAIHIEEGSNVNLTINNCRLVDFRVGIFTFGDLTGGRLTCSDSYLQYGSGNYNGSMGWTTNFSGSMPMDFHGCVLTVGSNAFTSNAGPDVRYYGCKFDYNTKAIILSNTTAVYQDCRFLNITASTPYFFFGGSQTFRGCQFYGTANIAFNPSGGTFTEVTNCVSYGPVLTVPADKCSIDYIGFTLANLGVNLPAGIRQFNSTTRYISNLYNIFPNYDGLCGYGAGSTSGGGSFTASATTVPSPIWVNHSKATLIVKFSDGSAPYVFTPETFWNPAAYGRGYYVQNIKRSTTGTWVADGAVVTKGDPSSAGFQGTTANGFTWTATGAYSFACQVIIIPRYLDTYIL